MKRSQTSLEPGKAVGTNRYGSPCIDRDLPTGSNPQTGYAHLLRRYTVNQIVFMSVHDGDDIRAFLCEGLLPSDRTIRNAIANLMHLLDEPEVYREMLKLGNLIIPIRRAKDIGRLHDAISFEPAGSFQGIGLQIEVCDPEIARELIPSLIELLRTGQLTGEIELLWGVHGFAGLPGLLDELTHAGNLALCIAFLSDSSGAETATLVKLAELLKHNKAVYRFELLGMWPTMCRGDSNSVSSGILHGLEEQPSLKVLGLPLAGADDIRLTGNLLKNSHSLEKLDIELVGTFPIRPLIKGLMENSTLGALNVKFNPFRQHIDKSISHALSIISLFQGNQCTASQLTLDMSQFGMGYIAWLFNAEYEYTGKKSVIENLIAGNTTIRSLTLRVPDTELIDLVPIGKGLKRNRHLDSLCIGRDPNGLGIRWSSLYDQNTVPAFLKELSGNETVSNLVIDDFHRLETARGTANELARILSRNKAFGNYACSFGYLHGAVAGLLQSVNLPTDVAKPIAEFLAGQINPAASREIAYVNKATSRGALHGRSSENTAALAQVARTLRNGEIVHSRDTAQLFMRMAVRPQDFSDDDLRNIVGSELFMPGLTCLLLEDPHFFHPIADRIDAVAGIKNLRRKVIGDFVEEELGKSPFEIDRMHLLQERFMPDQQHLAYLMQGTSFAKLFIHPQLIREFVNYDLLPESDDDTVVNDVLKEDVFEWCLAENHPEIYLAFMENYPDAQLSTIQMLPHFRTRFLSKVSLCRSVKHLDIMDFDDETDAEAVDAIISNSPLQHLRLLDSLCSDVTFNLLMRRLSINTGLKRVEIRFYEGAETFPVTDSIMSVLQANPTLALAVEVPPNHPEWVQLTELALAESRFNIGTSRADETSSDSDEHES